MEIMHTHSSNTYEFPELNHSGAVEIIEMFWVLQYFVKKKSFLELKKKTGAMKNLDCVYH